MIRCVRLFTDKQGQSKIEEGFIQLSVIEGEDKVGLPSNAVSISFRQTSKGGSFDWHTAPTRQYVLTLSGVLEFETRAGECFRLSPGDVLLAEDTIGGGHKWSLLNDEPWRRAYIVLPLDESLPFVVAQ